MVRFYLPISKGFTSWWYKFLLRTLDRPKKYAMLPCSARLFGFQRVQGFQNRGCAMDFRFISALPHGTLNFARSTCKPWKMTENPGVIMVPKEKRWRFPTTNSILSITNLWGFLGRFSPQQGVSGNMPQQCDVHRENDDKPHRFFLCYRCYRIRQGNSSWTAGNASPNSSVQTRRRPRPSGSTRTGTAPRGQNC